MERHSVDMVFNGHPDGYERGEMNGVFYITTGGGGGTLDHFCQNWDHVEVSVYEHHLVRVDAGHFGLSIVSLTPDGKQLDRVALSR